MSQNDIFVFLLFRNPHAKGTKAPVSFANIEMWLQRCNDIAEYIFALKMKKATRGFLLFRRSNAKLILLMEFQTPFMDFGQFNVQRTFVQSHK